MRREQVEAEIRRRGVAQARADARSRAARLESGAVPSGLYRGQRVEILAVQDHPLAGPRVWIRDGLTHWVPAAEVGDIRGTPTVSVVPPGLFPTAAKER